MPKPNDYPRWRYIAMQASMWGVLLCTVGIAALASNYKRGSTMVTLGEPQALDSVSVRLPNDWIIDRRESHITASDSLEATRIIEVRERHLSWVDRLAEVASTQRKAKPISIGPILGELRERRRTIDRRISIVELEAVGMLKNGNRLSITVSQAARNSRDDADALELLTDVAKSVQYVSQ